MWGWKPFACCGRWPCRSGNAWLVGLVVAFLGPLLCYCFCASCFPFGPFTCFLLGVAGMFFDSTWSNVITVFFISFSLPFLRSRSHPPRFMEGYHRPPPVLAVLALWLVFPISYPSSITSSVDIYPCICTHASAPCARCPTNLP